MTSRSRLQSRTCRHCGASVSAGLLPVAEQAAASIIRSEHEATKVSDRTAEEVPGNDEMRVRVYTVEQVAEILQIGRDKVFMLLRTGRLRSIKIDRLRRITHRQLADYVASLESMP